mmetsp:Transcript_25804/g.48092  ORF Transcript_25804/g.48092 Transcript_25804/m.48092 type:complete len:206 (-) Transcript_25804:273-890(-)
MAVEENDGGNACGDEDSRIANKKLYHGRDDNDAVFFVLSSSSGPMPDSSRSLQGRLCFCCELLRIQGLVCRFFSIRCYLWLRFPFPIFPFLTFSVVGLQRFFSLLSRGRLYNIAAVATFSIMCLQRFFSILCRGRLYHIATVAAFPVVGLKHFLSLLCRGRLYRFDIVTIFVWNGAILSFLPMLCWELMSSFHIVKGVFNSLCRF